MADIAILGLFSSRRADWKIIPKSAGGLTRLDCFTLYAAHAPIRIRIILLHILETIKPFLPTPSGRAKPILSHFLAYAACGNIIHQPAGIAIQKAWVLVEASFSALVVTPCRKAAIIYVRHATPDRFPRFI
jgi:hypothetical protein